MNVHVSRFLIGLLVMLGLAGFVLGIVIIAEVAPKAFYLLILSPLVYLTGALAEDLWSVMQKNKDE